MNFAQKYLLKQSTDYIHSGIGFYDARLIVVIPCFNEPDIINTLESLLNCTMPDCNVGILVVVNEPFGADESIVKQNDQTIRELQVWGRKFNSAEFSISTIEARGLPVKWAGAGWARKIGMDEAVRHYAEIDDPSGIIVSLDADCVVEANYFVEILKHFKENPKGVAATLHFEHPVIQEGMEERIREGIVLYELYMRYYKNALSYTGFPNAMYTIGSAFAVKAEAYVKQGGMNRKKAGEDFYFLQKLTQLGTVGAITSTMVIPSARLSDRVPFGTGPVLQKWVDGVTDLAITYQLSAFNDLKEWFAHLPELYEIDADGYQQLLALLPEPVSSFLTEDSFWTQLHELQKNCSGSEVFQKRFFDLFNAFKVLKYLNYCRDNYYPDSSLIENVKTLLLELGQTNKVKYLDILKLLEIFRDLDRRNDNKL